MGISVEEALKSREERKKKEQQEAEAKSQASDTKVDAALDAYKRRKQSNAQSAVSDIVGRINSEIETINKIETPFWGESSKNALETTRQNRINIGNLKKEVESYRSYLDEDTYNSITSTLNSLSDNYSSYLSSADIRSKFNSEEDYNDYQIGWLYEDAETNEQTTGARKAKYQSNADRIAELKEQLPWYKQILQPFLISDEDRALRTELEALESENRQYERTQKTVDDYYVPVTPEFEQNAAYRDYSNATKEELYAYDMSLSEGSLALNNGGYFDEEGNIRDRDGNIVQYANAPEVQDKLGMFLSSSDEDVATAYNELVATNGNYTNTWAELMREGDINAWKYLKPEEINIYYDLYRREGQEAAYKFLEDMTVELTRRATQATSEYIEQSPWYVKGALNLLSFPMNVVGGAVGLVGDAANLISGKDYNPYSRTHSLSNTASATRQAVAADIDEWTGGAALPLVGFTFGDAYQAIMSFGDSALASVIPGGRALLFANGASAEMKDLYERGASIDQMLAGGVLAGAAESFFEKYSIDRIKAIKNMDSKSVKTLTDRFVQTLVTGGVEASEEMATEIANTISDALVMGTQTDWVDLETFVKNVVNAGIGGFISGDIFGGIATRAKSAQNNIIERQQGQTIMEKGGSDILLELANEQVKNTSDKTLGKYTAKATKKTTAKTVGRVSALLEENISEQNRTEIESALVEKGLSKKEAKRVSAYLKSGADLTEAQIEEVESNENIKAVAEKLLSDPDSSINERGKKLLAARLGVKYNTSSVAESDADNGVDLPVSVPENSSELVSDDEAKGLVEGEIAVSESGNTIDAEGNTVEFQEFSNISDSGVGNIRLDNGMVVEASTLSFGTEAEASLVEGLLNIKVDGKHLNAEIANALYKQGKALIASKPNMSARDVVKYITGISESYVYGYYNFSKERLTAKDGKGHYKFYAAEIDQTDRDYAYNFGKQAAKANTETSPKRKKTSAAVKKDNVIYEDGLDFDNMALSPTQKASLDGIKLLAEISPLSIHVFKSEAIDGKYRYTMPDGTVVGANGWYVEGTNDVYIDINAGNSGEGIMIRTAAHEISHYIRDWSPHKWKVMADFLMEEYGRRDVPVEDLLERQMNKVKNRYKKNGEELPALDKIRDEAYEELVCDALSDMLTDGSVVDKLSELKQKDENLWKKIGEAIRRLLEKWGVIKEKYSEIELESPEAKLLHGMDEAFSKLKEMYAEAFEAANDAFDNANDAAKVKNNDNKVPSSNPDIRYSEKDYSYAHLVRKGKIEVNRLADVSQSETVSFSKNHDLFAKQMRKIAAQDGNPKNTATTTFLYCKDLDADVLITRDSFKHGSDRTMDYTYISVCKSMTDILKNSIVVNEVTNRSDTNGGYVLLGLAENKDSYVIVRSIVNKKTWKLEEYNELYAIRKKSIKKEDAGFMPPHYSFKEGGYGSSSVISISDFLRFVNNQKIGNSVLSLDVVKKLGAARGNDSKITPHLLFHERDEDTVARQEKINKVIDKENAKLKEDNKYLKDLLKLQRTVTHGTKFTKSSVDAMAGRLMKSANARGNRAELSRLLNDVYEYIARGEDLTWESISDKAVPAVKWLQNNRVVKKELDPFAKEILAELRDTRVYLDDLQKKEAAYAYGSYNEFRQRAMGSVVLTEKNAISLDSKWVELSDMYPSYFDPETKSNDMPMQLLEIVHSLRNTYADDMEYFMYGDMITQDLLYQVYDGYWDVSTLHTVADVKQKEIDRLKREHRVRLREVRDYHREKEAELKQEYADKMSRLRKDYRERIDKQAKTLSEKYQESRKKAVEKVRETREKRDAITKLQKLVLETSKWLRAPSKTDVKCPDILKEPYAGFLSSIDLSSKRALSGGEATHNDLRVASAMDSLAKAIERIRDSQNPNLDTDDVLDAGYLDLPENFVVVLKKTAEDVKKMMVGGDYVVNLMDSSEIKQLSKMIRTLNHAIKEMSTLYTNLRFANVEALGADTLTFLESLGKVDSTNTVSGFVGWDNALPYYAFKRFGNGGTSTMETLMDAQDKLAFLADRIFKFKDETWTDKQAREWSEDTHTIELPSGNTLTLTTADAMSIYCLSRREQAVPHLLQGGVRVPGQTKGGKTKSDSSTNLTQEDISYIISTLSESQIKVADAIQEFMSTVCADWGNEISMKRFLTKEFTERYYFPIESNDENLPVKDPQAQQSDLYRLLNISATKALTQGANNQIIIRNIFDVFANHSSDMARLNAYGLALLDYMKWLNYHEKTVGESGQITVKSTKKAMNDAFGNKAFSYALNLIKDINGRYNDSGSIEWLGKMTRNAKVASVAGNLRVAVLQMTSYPRAALVLSPGSLAKGLSKAPKIDMAKKYCGIALWKSFGFYDTNIGRSVEEQIKGAKNIRQKLIELSLKGAEWGDAITWGCLWNACEYEVAKTKQYQVGTEEFYSAVGNKLREVVYATQVVDSTLTRSQVMRKKDGVSQMATAFMSEPTLSANILMDAGFQFNLEKRRTGSAKAAWKKTGKYITRAVTVYSVGQLIAAAVEGLMDAYRDDDDEEFKDKFIEAFNENAITDLIPLNKIPVLSDFTEFILSQFGVGYFSSDNLSTTWLTQLNTAIKSWSKVLSGEESSTTVYNAIYNTTRALSSMSGLPGSNLMREVITLWNNTAGASDITRKVKTYKRTKAELGQGLYEAIIEGDIDKAGSLREKFEDENTISSALVKAIVENDQEIVSVASDYINEDFSSYNSKVDELISQGFDAEVSAKAIRSVVSKVESAAQAEADGDTEKYEEKVAELVNLGYDEKQLTADIKSLEAKPLDVTEKAKSRWSKDDYLTAVTSGDSTMADTIKEDLIETEVKNGKTKEEAEKSLDEALNKRYKEEFFNGDMSESEVEDWIRKYYPDKTDCDVYWELKKWKTEKEHQDDPDYSYNKFGEYYEAILAGDTKSMNAFVTECRKNNNYTDNVNKEVASDIATNITNHFKPMYIAATSSERVVLKQKLLSAYTALGYAYSKRSKLIDEWLED